MSVLNSDAVTALFMDSLFKDEELPEDGSAPEGAVMVEGIIHAVGFHPERLESHREEVKAMLLELPLPFRMSEGEKGGGWSFLNACNNKDDEQWTGFHAIMEQLFVLGIGLGLCEFQLPREVWSVLPGGMPYIGIKDKDW